MTTEPQQTPAISRGALPALLGLLLLGAAALLAPADWIWPQGPASTLPVRMALWGAALATAGGGVYLIARRRSVSLVNLAMAAGVSLACLAICEAVLALKGVQPLKRIVWRTPALVPWWQLDPAQGGRFLPEKYTGSWTINAQGFADSDPFDEAKAAGIARRILLLGDSYAYGASASSPAKSFAELIDRSLDATVETIVWDLAIPGTGQESQFHLLSEYLPILKPQIVIATLYLNDFEDNQYPPDQFYVFADGNWVQRYTRVNATNFEALSPDAAYRRAFAPQYPREYLKALRTTSAVANLIHRWWPKPTSSGMTSAGAPVPGYMEMEKWLGRIRDAAAGANARLIVLLIPERADLGALTPAYRDMQESCGALGLECVEVLADLKAEDYALPPDGHWNDHGHAKVTARLHDAIEKVWDTAGPAAK